MEYIVHVSHDTTQFSFSLLEDLEPDLRMSVVFDFAWYPTTERHLDAFAQSGEYQLLRSVSSALEGDTTTVEDLRTVISGRLGDVKIDESQ